MSNMLLVMMCAASLAACHFQVQQGSSLPMMQFPAAAHAPELEAIEPAVARAFTETHAGLEVVKVVPYNTHWDIGRNENTGIVMRRGAAFHLEFRKDGRCYYARPVFWEEHVDSDWEAPRFAGFETLWTADIGDVQREHVAGIDAALVSCDDAPGAPAQVAATRR